LKLSQFYNVLRFALGQKKKRWEKLVMAMQVLDLLEQDYREIYPNEPPLLEGGFEKAMKDIMLPK